MTAFHLLSIFVPPRRRGVLRGPLAKFGGGTSSVAESRAVKHQTWHGKEYRTSQHGRSLKSTARNEPAISMHNFS